MALLRSQAQQTRWWSLSRLALGCLAAAVLMATLPHDLWSWPLGRKSASDRPRGLAAPYRYELPKVPPSPDHDIALYLRRSRNDPTGSRDLLYLATLYGEKAALTGDPSWYLLAERAALKSLRNLPASSNSGAVLALANVAQARHDFRAARDLISQIQRDRNDPRLGQHLLAKIHLAVGDYAVALAAAQHLVESFPSAEAYVQRGLVRAALGRDKEAIRDFRTAIDREQPGAYLLSALCRAWLARLHASRGRLGLAADLLAEADRIVPDHPVILSMQAAVALKAERYQDAEAIYATVFGRSRSGSDLAGQARAQLAQGEIRNAEATLDQAEKLLRHELKGDEFGHRRDLAQLLLERGGAGRHREALKLMEREVAHRHDTQTLSIYAWALGRNGRWSEALETCQRALQAGAKDPQLYAHAALAAMNLNQPAASARYLAAAETLDPAIRRDSTVAMGVPILWPTRSGS